MLTRTCLHAYTTRVYTYMLTRTCLHVYAYMLTRTRTCLHVYAYMLTRLCVHAYLQVNACLFWCLFSMPTHPAFGFFFGISIPSFPPNSHKTHPSLGPQWPPSTADSAATLLAMSQTMTSGSFTLLLSA